MDVLNSREWCCFDVCETDRIGAWMRGRRSRSAYSHSSNQGANQHTHSIDPEQFQSNRRTRPLLFSRSQEPFRFDSSCWCSCCRWRRRSSRSRSNNTSSPTSATGAGRGGCLLPCWLRSIDGRRRPPPLPSRLILMELFVLVGGGGRCKGQRARKRGCPKSRRGRCSLVTVAPMMSSSDER